MFYKNKIGSIYYEVYGPENAPAIVFCHGVSMDYQTFNEQIEALKENYRVIVWDMPYHGKSSEINDNLLFSSTAADFIIELLEDLEIDKSIIVGLSLGSFVAQQTAIKYPEKVAATVHISGGSLYPKYPSIIKAYTPLFSLFLKLYPEKALPKYFAKHKAITPDTQAYLEEVCSKTGKKTLIHLIKEMVNDMTQGLPQQPQQPTLITYGDHDFSFIKKLALKMHTNNPNSQLAMIENAHHIANQDNPEGFNKVLISFLKSIDY